MCNRNFYGQQVGKISEKSVNNYWKLWCGMGHLNGVCGPYMGAHKGLRYSERVQGIFFGQSGSAFVINPHLNDHELVLKSKVGSPTVSIFLPRYKYLCLVFQP